MKKLGLTVILLAISSCGSMDINSEVTNADSSSVEYSYLDISSGADVTDALKTAVRDCTEKERGYVAYHLADTTPKGGGCYGVGYCQTDGTEIKYTYVHSSTCTNMK